MVCNLTLLVLRYFFFSSVYRRLEITEKPDSQVHIDNIEYAPQTRAPNEESILQIQYDLVRGVQNATDMIVWCAREGNRYNIILSSCPSRIKHRIVLYITLRYIYIFRYILVDGVQRCEAFRRLSKLSYDTHPDAYLPIEKDLDIFTNSRGPKGYNNNLKKDTSIGQSLRLQTPVRTKSQPIVAMVAEETEADSNGGGGDDGTDIGQLADVNNNQKRPRARSQPPEPEKRRNPYNRVSCKRSGENINLFSFTDPYVRRGQLPSCTGRYRLRILQI